MRFSSVSFVVLYTIGSAAGQLRRGVNIGSWLVLEKWITPDVFDAAPGSVDEWTFTQALGETAALSALESHWDSWFTEADVAKLSSQGINALRIPIGYWAFDSQEGEPYVQGAADRLATAITWARSYGMKVMITLHGLQGSQNGFDNSGRKGGVWWLSDSTSMPRIMKTVAVVAGTFGSSAYADVVTDIEIINEPVQGQDLGSIWSYYTNAYNVAKSAASNGNLRIVVHDAFTDLGYWNALNGPPTWGNMAMDTHPYQVFDASDLLLNVDGHVKKSCDWVSEYSAMNAIMPLYAGEWSTSINVCINPDGSSTAGTSCYVSGCQCSTDSVDVWNSVTRTQMRRFVEAQLDAFEKSTSGWFYWNFKMSSSSSWSFYDMVQYSIMPQPLTARQSPGQCGFTLSKRHTHQRRVHQQD